MWHAHQDLTSSDGGRGCRFRLVSEATIQCLSRNAVATCRAGFPACPELLPYASWGRLESLPYRQGPFSLQTISTEVEKDVQEKDERLAAPRHCSILPVLIHANQVSEGVQYGDVFARIIDFSDVLREGTP